MEENSLEQLQNELTDKFDELFPRAGEKKDLFENITANHFYKTLEKIGKQICNLL